ncbi:MAG: M1 family peptidase [Bacteroidetes bacterium]|nr:M1 family peptidase [Bacteroidota bacterium]
MYVFINPARLFLLASLTSLPMLSSAQNSTLKKQAIWQQRVDHDIHVVVDEKQKVLRCFQTIIYKNNSPDVIQRIPFHIWPNAFSGRHTAYGKEAIINGNKKFFNATEDEQGALDSLNFSVNGIPARYNEDSINPDIVYLVLPQSLNTGEEITIATPFRVKIPWLFSRMGYNGDLLSITQWYPKPAVYDVNGWNAFPYAEQGEYYSEFGDYAVNLDVPANWRVAATGELQDSAEFAWLDSLVLGRDTAERIGRKTLLYKQTEVSDFAWFAKPDFQVAKGKSTLPDGHEVTTFAFYKASKKVNGPSILNAIDKGLQYYSGRVGIYPYRYCSVVIGPLQGAGGMEYPMITICADASEGTIIHEVGHNWFQGMLGSQEREHPWMDESINTFYQQQAEGKGTDEYSPGDNFSVNSGYAAFRLTHDVGQFQCGHLHSRSYTGVNYGAIVYAINPQRFLYLQEYLGRSVMDSCMKTYFRKWQYKHPLPADLQATMEQVSGKKLGWFFNGLLAGAAPDVAIQSVKKSKIGYVVNINNKTPYELPFKLQWRYGTRKESMWVHSDTSLELAGKMQEIVLNASGYLPESNMANNDAVTSRAILKTWGKGKFGFPGFYKRGQNKQWVFPMFFMWNKYDGYTPGLIFSNITFPRRNWEYWIAPLYGVKSKDVVGFTGLRRNIFHHGGPFALTEIGFNLRRFNFLPTYAYSEPSIYNRWAFKVNQFFRVSKPWVFNRLETELTRVRLSETIVTLPSSAWESDVARVSWVRESTKKLMPFNTRLDIIGGGNKISNLFSSQSGFINGRFLMANATAEIYIPYPNKSKKDIGFRAKGFASGMMHNYLGGTGNFVLPISAPQFSPNDPTFSHMAVARSARFGSGNGYWSQMLVNGTNGIRMFPNLNTDKWVAGVNLNTHVLPFLPIQLFFDAAYVPASANLSEKLPYAGGLSYSTRVGKSSNFEATLPLFYSKTFRDFKSANPWFKPYEYATVRVKLDLNDPFDIIRNFIY